MHRHWLLLVHNAVMVPEHSLRGSALQLSSLLTYHKPACCTSFPDGVIDGSLYMAVSCVHISAQVYLMSVGAVSQQSAF